MPAAALRAQPAAELEGGGGGRTLGVSEGGAATTPRLSGAGKPAMKKLVASAAFSAVPALREELTAMSGAVVMMITLTVQLDASRWRAGATTSTTESMKTTPGSTPSTLAMETVSAKRAAEVSEAAV